VTFRRLYTWDPPPKKEQVWSLHRLPPTVEGGCKSASGDRDIAGLAVQGRTFARANDDAIAGPAIDADRQAHLHVAPFLRVDYRIPK
jgi:hypothetical protein